MAKSATGSGMAIYWGAEHIDGNGRLISRQAMVPVPPPPKCIRPSCLLRYLFNALVYVLICSYHERRTAYAEANRNKEILERYRTGEKAPTSLWSAIIANIKLTCPICRRVETKW